MAGRDKYAFIINPKSGAGKPLDRFAALIHRLGIEHEIDVSIWFWERPGQLPELIERAKQSGVTRIYAMGGDGTMRAIGDSLKGSKIALGVIPGGSGNALAGHLGVSLAIPKAIDQAFNSYPVTIDTGIANGDFFLMFAGLGMDSFMLSSFSQTTHGGLSNYVKATTRAYFAFKPIQCNVLSGATLQSYADLLFINAMNVSQWGGRLCPAPGARMDDGQFDLVVSRAPGILQAPGFLMDLLNGNIDKHELVQRTACTAVQITLPEPYPYQLDGDLMPPVKSLDISIQPASLDILVPNQPI